jgi:hypothetical protein
MHPDELMHAALRVLTAIDRGRSPNNADLQILRRNAQPGEKTLSVHELAGRGYQT